MRLWRMAAAVFAMSPAGMTHAESCLHYTEPVHVVGTLAKSTVPGPPNWESVADGDEPQIAWFLMPAQPVCTKENPHRKGIDLAFRNVAVLHLYFDDDLSGRFHSLLNTHVAVTGWINSGVWAWDRSPVVLKVTDLRPARP